MEWDCEDCNLEAHAAGILPESSKTSPSALINPVNITNRPFKRPHSPDNTSSSGGSSNDESEDIDVESVIEVRSSSSQSRVPSLFIALSFNIII